MISDCVQPAITTPGGSDDSTTVRLIYTTVYYDIPVDYYVVELFSVHQSVCLSVSVLKVTSLHLHDKLVIIRISLFHLI